MNPPYLHGLRLRYRTNAATLQQRFKPFWLRHKHTAHAAQYALRISIVLAITPLVADMKFRPAQGLTDGQMLLFVGCIFAGGTIAFIVAEAHNLITVDDGDTE